MHCSSNSDNHWLCEIGGKDCESNRLVKCLRALSHSRNCIITEYFTFDVSKVCDTVWRDGSYGYDLRFFLAGMTDVI